MIGFGEVAERLRRSTVVVSDGGRGGGSGVIWSSSGIVITNAHVAQGSRAQIKTWDGAVFEAEVKAKDDRRDLAILAFAAHDLASAPLREAAPRSGEMVVAVGNPLGFVGAVSTGVVHAVGAVPGLGRRQWVQASVRLAPGNSGGPLADAQGRVIGINTMIVQGGLALAIPAAAIARFLATGESAPKLGIAVRPMRWGHRVALLVIEVENGSAAASASLLPGDLLLAVNGREIASPADLGDGIDSSPGQLRLEFLRGDRRLRREVVVLLPPPRAAAA
jgi:serine protease Do